MIPRFVKILFIFKYTKTVEGFRLSCIAYTDLERKGNGH